jgi:NADP-dependent 3-hydroxy acid dehydrogenase YdfG
MEHNGLEGRIALVTGASSGIGRAISLALSEQKAGLALVGRNKERLRDAAEECEKRGAKAKIYPVDLTDDVQLQRLKDQLAEDWGGIDILIHSAGVIKPGDWLNASLDNFDWQYRCNVRAPFALIQLFLPILIRRQGQVVFINSTSGLIASAGNSQYGATKHALKALADSLRDEVNPLGVRVISIYPGKTATPMQLHLHEIDSIPYRSEQLIQPEQIASAVLQALTIGRDAEITDIRIRPFKKLHM